MSSRELKVFSLTSGLLNAPLEVGHGLQGGLERDNDPRAQPWNPQNGRLQKTLSKSSAMSNESLKVFSLTSGEYICNYLKLWVISTTKENEETTLQSDIS